LKWTNPQSALLPLIGKIMRIVIAPDSFKGSLSALQVANAIETGLLIVFHSASMVKITIADGGEGTVDAMVAATNVMVHQRYVQGPLGDKTKSFWGILGDGQTAVIEMAAASGFTCQSALGPRNLFFQLLFLSPQWFCRRFFPPMA
jgi:glycerate kinase